MLLRLHYAGLLLDTVGTHNRHTDRVKAKGVGPNLWLVNAGNGLGRPICIGAIADRDAVLCLPWFCDVLLSYAALHATHEPIENGTRRDLRRDYLGWQLICWSVGWRLC